MNKTGIEWTDMSSNPIRAMRKSDGKKGWYCQRVSQGCRLCYSATLNNRFGTRVDYSIPNADQVHVYLDVHELERIMKLKTPKKIFICDMTDLFGEFVDFELIDWVFAVIAACPQHTFQVLTKRPKRMFEYFWVDGYQKPASVRVEECADILLEKKPGPVHWIKWPLPNVWLGTSAEDQPNYDARFEWLMKTPAAIHFLSLEPLLGPIDLGFPFVSDNPWMMQSHVDWVIVGGESGPKARPAHVDWVRSIRDQCQEAGIPFFMKQNGEWLHDSQFTNDERLELVQKELGTGRRHKFHYWPDGTFSVRVGKKAAGRLLDGREWNEFPEV